MIMEKINWGDLSNSEIESKLKSLEFLFEKTKTDINNLYSVLDYSNNEYIMGKQILISRLKPKNK